MSNILNFLGNSVKMMRKLVRIPEDADIPMIGLINVGLIDRGTNLIQVRAISGCNLNCIFCSTDAGPFSKTRQAEYMVIDPELLVDKFIEQKQPQKEVSKRRERKNKGNL